MKLATIIVAAALAVPAVSSFAQSQPLTRAEVKVQLVEVERASYTRTWTARRIRLKSRQPPMRRSRHRAVKEAMAVSLPARRPRATSSACPHGKQRAAGLFQSLIDACRSHSSLHSR